MKKIFSFFVAALFSVTMLANQYWFSGSTNGWGATPMTPSALGQYEYIQIPANSGNVQFKIKLNASSWDNSLDDTYIDNGFVTDEIFVLNCESGDKGNCIVCAQEGAYYVLVFKPNTVTNKTANPKICFGEALPNESDWIKNVTLYFVNVPGWTDLKAHVWSGSDEYKAWANNDAMTLTETKVNGFDVYSYTFPEIYTQVIFHGSAQTADLTWDADKPYFYPETTNGSGQYNTKWYASVGEIPVPGYYLRNSWGTNDWTQWREMEKDGDVYVLEKVVFGGEGVAYNTIESQTGETWVGVTNFAGDAISALDTVTFTLNPAAEKKISVKLEGKYFPEIKLHGTFAGSEWTDGEAFVPAADRNSSSLTLKNLAVGTYEFKVKKNGSDDLLGKENGTKNYELSRTWPGVKNLETGNDVEALSLIVDKAGDYKFTYTFATDSLGVDFPELVASAVTITAPTHGTITVLAGEAAIGETVQENTILSVAAAVKSADQYDYKVSNLRAFKTGDVSTVVAINEGKLTMPAFPITITADESEIIYLVAGSEDLLGANWDKEALANKMVRQDNGSYKLEKTEVSLAAATYKYKLVIDGEWQGDNDEEVVLAKSGQYTLTWTYVPSTSTFALVPVLTKEEVVKPSVSLDFGYGLNALEEAETTAWKTIELAEGVHTFRVVVGANWIGKQETIKRNNAGYGWIDLGEGTSDDEIEFWADKAGDYTFTFAYADSTITVTYPTRGEGEAPAAWLAGQFGTEKAWIIQPMTRANDNKSASIKLNLEASMDYEFKLIINNEYVSNGYTYHSGFKSSTVTGNEKNMKLSTSYEGDYILTWTYLDNSIAFTFPEATAVDNTEAAVKAVKMIENGQLIIIKNGVKYNATGAVVK